MIFRRFFAVSIAILLCSALFFGSFTQFAFADVVHAYRKPSEADLQWLLGDNSTLDASDIVQVGFSTHSDAFIWRRNPCSPVKMPIPMPPPPAQRTANNKMNAGLEPEIEGVININPIVIDAATPVVQMTSERLPPPSEVPQEQSLAADPTVAPLPLPNERELFRDAASRPIIDFDDLGCGDFDDEQPVSCICATCVTCGNRLSNKIRFSAPDMFGSSAWLTGYSVGTTGATPSQFTSQFTLPTMLLVRPNVVERFNADVQNRIWADYRYWNNAVTIDGERRAVEQFSFGLEKKLLRKSSLELRVPVISQFGSQQTAMDMATSVELGNISVFAKQVLRQGSRWTVSGGVGVTLPTAEDWRSPVSTARLNNEVYYLVSFLGAQWHPNDKTFGHFIVQTDMPIAKNELVFGTDRQKVEGQQVIRAGIQLGRWIYRIDHGKRPCRLGTFAEIHYAVVTDGSGQRELTAGGDSIYVSAFDTRKSALTAAVGVPMVFGKLTCANSLILPISGSNRPFSVGYSFSLSRQF